MRLINFHAGRRHAIQLVLALMSVLLVGAILVSAPRSEAKSAVALPADRPHAGGVPRPDHVLVVIEENHSYPQIIGSSQAPYINGLAQQGALFTNSHGIQHPSEPNYLDLFSGSNQGVNNDNCPYTFSAANLGSELLSAGLGFTGYSEDLPSPGSTVCSSGGYLRRHSPWVNFTNIPSAYNLPFTSYPSDYTTLPTLSFVIPNIYNDMHTGTIQQGDTWLQQHIDPYVQWARTHNSLLILTWDEDDYLSSNWIPTIFVGPMVVAGRYGEAINHYNVLRTMEDMYDLPYAGNSGSVAPITDIWTTSITATPTSTSLPADTPTTTPTSTATNTPTPTPTNINSFSHLEPAGPLTVMVGDKFTLDLMVNSGFNNIINQNSYMTFTNSILQVVRVSSSGCVITNTLTPDTNTFDTVFTNRVCNGNNPCTFGSNTVPPASITFESGVISNPSAQGDFRVAQIAFCPVATGDAVIHWQFSPPAPPERDSEIVDENNNIVSNPTLYTDYMVHVVIPTPTSTGTPTNTPTDTPTDTPTSTPTNTPALVNLVGHVTWAGQNQPNSLQQRPITLTLCSTSGGPASTYTGTTDVSGYFTMNVASLVSGTYNWRDKGRNSLANGGTLTLTGSNQQQAEMDAQRGGDSNGDNVANVQDFNILRATFQSTTDPRADYNNDGVVGSIDFNILRSNYGQAGVPVTCP